MAKRRDREPRESRLAAGWTVESEATAAVADAEAADAADGAALAGPDAAALADPDRESGGVLTHRAQLSSGSLVLLGAIGGLYLLYTYVWFSWANYYSVMNSAVADGSGIIGSVMQQVVFWIAPLAPALWFVTVLLMNRGAGLGRVVFWLVIGAIVLVPLPMFNLEVAA